ncbi:MAG: SNF2-related protein [Acidiferrobacterales bacterium]
MSVGQITYRDGCWRIECAAHVRTKLRRLFPEASQRAGETITLSGNDENCRDLLWFLGRYPMDIEDDALDRLRAGSARHVDEQAQVTALLDGRHPPGDFALALPPRDYQVVAAQMLAIKRGLLIADDVGVGKTVTGICPMAQSDNLPALVVTLTHLPPQWAAELARFAPQLKVHTLKSGRTYDLLPKRSKKSGEEPRLPDVLISNYHKLSGWAETLAGVVRYVVFDEIQELRRRDSNKYAAARHIAHAARLRAGLSATPILNYGEEFFNVLEILRPGALGTSEEFSREWCANSECLKDPPAFGAYLRAEGLMLRRTRAEVGRELPPVIRIPQIVETDPEVLARIEGSAVELAKTILAANECYRGQKFRAAEEFNVLMRQATGVAKAPYVAQFVRLLLESERKIVLYGWHRDVYAIWMELLAEFHPRLYTGSESPTQKEDAKEAFLHGDCRLLIMSLRSGAGLDGLQSVCRTAVFGELDWSPGVHEQCIGRIGRDGQLDPVAAYYLIAEDGADPIIADILGLKRGQIEGVRNPGESGIERLERESGAVRRLADEVLRKSGLRFDDCPLKSPSPTNTTGAQGDAR